VAWLCLPKPALTEKISFSRRIFDRNGHQLWMTLSRDEKYRVFTPLDHISPQLVRATLEHEDRFFWEHPGINPIAATRAFWHFACGEKRGGASTITMQLARLSSHRETRTVRGKLAQMLHALELERHYSKSELLEAYLNLAPYGRNIEGVGAASEIYFGKEAGRLSLHEAIALSLIPQSPSRRALRAIGSSVHDVARDRLYLALTTSSCAIDHSFVARSEAKHAMLAPHFTTQVLAATGATEVRTTLDLDLQRLVERRITGYVDANRVRGIRNAAAMLVDFSTMEVLAQVGSANFAETAIHGQVDGTRSGRSPGSTLKPFIYALALDQGLIHPLTMLKDAPHRFGAFDPENFDREFIGPIKATDALARSRNIPAVSLAAQLHGPTLYGFLKSAGVHLPHDERFYGLALPLGGVEITMEDLVRIYCALANDGELRPLRRTSSADDRRAPPLQVVSREAAFLTLEMLGQIPRPDFSAPMESDDIFWKTGTSQGFHDAWTIAIFDHYVLAVWVGNFDGKNNPAFVGRAAAAPLLFQIVDAMQANGSAHPSRHHPPPNANLRRVELCAVSGELPNAACRHRISGWFIPGVSPISECEIHREIWVDDATGLRVSSDDGTRKVHREIYEFWPSDLLALFEQAGMPRRVPPPFLPDCDVEALGRSGRPPRITSPKRNLVYSLGEITRSERALSLSAETEPDVAKIYWFADRAFLGVSNRNTPLLWQPKLGRYKIVALDDHGRSDSCPVTFGVAEAATQSAH
jgi:penicillin-binding protein 1C